MFVFMKHQNYVLQGAGQFGNTMYQRYMQTQLTHRDDRTLASREQTAAATNTSSFIHSFIHSLPSQPINMLQNIHV